MEATNANFYDSSFKFNLKENDFKIAVGVYDYSSREPKLNPDYVRWQPFLVEDIGGSDIYKPLKFHICTDEDFAEFFPVAERSAKRVQELKDSKALICLDDEELQEDKIEVYGEDEHSHY